ncbi:hypothetical protein BKA70DRAFT_1147044 [Coprinopsis sp. MPI-PUGE-AT-0042]|nr:hypothetical protein BKA70DRAFT_1147044 [Coprinopsis sp. MPI-PUGE-AT-0042]
MSKKIPKQLHAELSEYTTLLRALKTRDLLDLSAQLQAPELTRRAEWEPKDSSDQPRPLTYKKEIWTRWPLDPKDIYVPIWEMQDEVAVVSRCVLKQQRASDSEREDDAELDSDDDDDPDLPPYTYHITNLLNSFLDHIFATLALHTPPRPRSMLNRIAPLNWEFVLNTLAGDLNSDRGVVTEEMLQNASRRLQGIYGPPGDRGHLTRAQQPSNATASHASSESPRRSLSKARGASLLSVYKSTFNTSTLLQNATEDFWDVSTPRIGTQDKVERLERQARRKKGRPLPEDDDESDYRPPRKVVKRSKSQAARGSSTKAGSSTAGSSPGKRKT